MEIKESAYVIHKERSQHMNLIQPLLSVMNLISLILITTHSGLILVLQFTLQILCRD